MSRPPLAAGPRKFAVGTGVALLSALAVAALAPGQLRAAPLTEVLDQKAPEIVTYLKGNYENVGVLKFDVKKDGRFSDHVGTLNMKFADRLETALVLANDTKAPLNIIHKASLAAAGVKGADHHTKAGLEALFAFPGYPLLWGGKRVRGDAFVTGKIEPAPARMSMDVVIEVYTPKGVDRTFTLNADLDANLLAEIGQSYSRLRGLVPVKQLEDNPDDQNKQANQVIQQAFQDDKKPATHPLLDPLTPVQVRVYYTQGGVEREMKPRPAGNDLTIDTPAEGVATGVRIELSKTQPTDDAVYGVVLKVNGENTLMREKETALRCTKWILDKEQPKVSVYGYSTSDVAAVPFQIVAEKEAAEFNYGDKLGQISVEVFRGVLKQPADLPPGDFRTARLKNRAAAIEGGLATQLQAAPKDAAEAKRLVQEGGSTRSLFRSAGHGSRGVMIPDKTGKKIDLKLTRVPFNPEATPVFEDTILYHTPARP
jgi:hypothetical protein